MIVRIRGMAVMLCLAALSGAAVAADAAKKSGKTTAAPKTPLIEKFTCRTGPNDEQVRLIAEVVKSRPMEFAYYSRLGTWVCSIHGRRGDAYTKWEDTGDGKTAVTLLKGSAQLEYQPGRFVVRFSAVDRMQFCGMYGELNGSVEALGTKPECGLSGVFD